MEATAILYNEDGQYIGPDSEYNDFGYDTRTGERWNGTAEEA